MNALRMGLVAGLAGFVCAFLAATASATETKADPAKPAATAPAAPPKAPARSDEEVMLDFYRTHQPEVYKFIEVVRAKDPAKYEGMKKELIRDSRDLLKIKDSKPAVFELRVKDARYGFRSVDLSRRIRSANSDTNPADLQKMRDELKEIVTKQFETRQQLRKIELEEQQKRLEAAKKQFEEMQKSLDDREKQKDELLNKRIEDLLKPTPKIDW